MGFIADLTRSKQGFGGNSQGDSLWRQVFGEDKEKPNRQLKPTYSRNLAGDMAFMRLLQALRSKAPGGWTDDRYEQSRHFVGITYVCVHRTGEQLAQAEFRVMEEDDAHPDGKKQIGKGHPGYGLIELLERPNNTDSFGD